MKALLVAALLTFAAFPALAQPQCFQSVHALKLISGFGEELHDQLQRKEPSGGVVYWSLWVNEETKSWTLTASNGGITCFVLGARDGYAGQSIEGFLTARST